METLNVGIAGCGIAGLAAALLLHRSGHSVTLYERFEEPRPLGSGLMLQPTGLAVLAELGLVGDMVSYAAPIERIFGRNDQGETVLDARYADLAVAGACGFGIHRASLFGVLYDAVVAAGIAVATGREVVGSGLNDGGRRLLFADADPSIPHDLIVDCLGVSSALAEPGEGWLPYGALWTTVEWPDDRAFHETWLEQRYRHARQMAGLLPIGRRRGTGRKEAALFWSLRADEFEHWRKRGLEAWRAEFIDLWPECALVLESIGNVEALTFARYAHRTHRKPVEERLIHLGDAWHSASPQLGQGANMALLDSWALAISLDGIGPLSVQLARAADRRRAHVRLYQWLTALFTPAYQSDAIWPALLRDMLLAPLSRVSPGPRVQAELVSGLTGGPLARLGLSWFPGTQPFARASATSAFACDDDQS